MIVRQAALSFGAAPLPRPQGEPKVYLGWYDPDKKKTAATKVSEAVERYVEKFGSSPAICLTSNHDASELGDEACGLPVRAVSYIGRYTYYVGVES